MMTQDQIIQTFKNYPKPLKSSVLRKLMKMFEDDLVDETIDQADAVGPELTVKERLAIVESLAGIASAPGKTPPTDEEWREARTDYLLEKYK